MADKKQTVELSELEQVELDFKKLQVRNMRRQMEEEEEKAGRTEAERRRQKADFDKAQEMNRRKQAICKHRKGGRDNRFAKGTDSNYSINLNTYPNGGQCISCTRCGKEVWKPEAALKRTDPKRYAEMWAEWKQWNEYPTDNSPSGSKMFELVA